MTYEAVYEIIARFARRELPVFADAWERFPTGIPAEIMAKELRDQAMYWKAIKPEISQKLTDAADEIDKRAEEYAKARAGKKDR